MRHRGAAMRHAQRADDSAEELVAHGNLDAKAIVVEAMRVAASICVFTNEQITVEVL